MDGKTLPLFPVETRHPARRVDPDTSHESAHAIRDTLGERQSSVFAFVARHPAGVIAAEVDEACGRGSWKRLSELRDAGLILDSGERRVAPSGRRQIVWRLQPKEAE